MIENEKVLAAALYLALEGQAPTYTIERVLADWLAVNPDFDVKAGAAALKEELDH